MNVNQISFGRVVKTNAQPKAVEKVVELLNDNGKQNRKNTQIKNDLLEVFDDVTIKGKARSVSFDNGKTSYILTGNESKELALLEDEKNFAIKNAEKRLGKTSNATQIIKEAEQDRFVDLAKFIVAGKPDAILSVETSKAEGIKSVNFLA